MYAALLNNHGLCDLLIEVSTHIHVYIYLYWVLLVLRMMKTKPAGIFVLYLAMGTEEGKQRAASIPYYIHRATFVRNDPLCANLLLQW